MAYIVPRVLIKQEFTQIPILQDQPLAALIVGPQFNLHRYSVEAEKASTAARNAIYGQEYQPTEDVVYSLPNQVLGTVTDEDYLKVFFENAEAEYFPNDISDTPATVERIQVPTNSKHYPNRFLATDLIFKTANGYSRSPEFSNRNIHLGDVIMLSSEDAGYEGRFKVKALHASKTESEIASATYAADNIATQAEDYNNAVTKHGSGGATVEVANASTAFKGGWTASGMFVATETFKVTVKHGGNLTAARFTVESPAGLFETRTDVPLAGGDLTVYSENSNDVVLDFSGSSLFVEDDYFTVQVFAPVNHTVVPTSGGDYTGLQNLSYKLTVVRGGPWFDGTNAATCARVSVSSDHIDSSATVNVQDDVAFKVGSYGVTATFASSSVTGGLADGQVYFIAVTPAADSEVNIIETYESLPNTFTGNNAVTPADDWEISSMRLVKSYQVSARVPNNDVDLNFEFDSTNQTLTINSGITTFDSSIYDGADLMPLDVKKANVFIEHRDLVTDNAISIGSFTSADGVDETLGTIHPDNPLAQGVYDALLNAAGVTVYYVGLNSNDLEGYTAALELARLKDLYYGLVPLTHDRSVIDAFVGHVNAQSTAEVAHWRKCWVSLPLTTSTLLYDVQEDNTDWTGTLLDDPLATDLDTPVYGLLTVEGAQFLTDEIRPHDKILINFRVNSQGQVVSDEYTVLEVRTETTLVLVDGPTSSIDVPVKVQIKRVYTRDEQINELALVAGDFNNRRVNSVFPTVAKNGTIEKPGYFVAAALAGLRSGTVPHQGLTNTEILGFTDLTQVVRTFSAAQLDRLAAEGIWIVTQDTIGSTPYVRHQLTTDSSGLNTSEDSVTTNVDSISYGLMRVLEPYIGKYNVYPGAVLKVRESIYNELTFRQTETFTVRAGNQLNGFTIVKLRQDPTFKDRINAEIQLQVPYPLNFIVVTLIV
jgi:hypothetical protein